MMEFIAGALVGIAIYVMIACIVCKVLRPSKWEQCPWKKDEQSQKQTSS